jgi:hypothetical protein
MVREVRLRVEDVWAKKAYDPEGNYLGMVEAVGHRRKLVRRVGVPVRDSQRRGLKFFSVDGARLDGQRLILPAADVVRLPPV